MSSFTRLSMARGVASPAPASLPKASFTKVVGENSTTRTGVHDNQQRSYGCVSMHPPFVRMLTGGQTMIFPYSRGRSTTFDTSVFLFPRGIVLLAEPSCLEPLESELAVQVEYDMDEQGNDCQS